MGEPDDSVIVVGAPGLDNFRRDDLPDRSALERSLGPSVRVGPLALRTDDVRQIISGSIGWDDWEWGVDLFANDPVVFKRLIYEMRFDEVSAKYALFGSFYVGVRLPIEKLSNWLSGSL